MSQVASENLIEDIPGEWISKSQNFNNFLDISGAPAGKMKQNSKKNKVNPKKEISKELKQAFVKLMDAQLTDGSFQGWFYDHS